MARSGDSRPAADASRRPECVTASPAAPRRLTPARPLSLVRRPSTRCGSAYRLRVQ